MEAVKINSTTLDNRFKEYSDYVLEGGFVCDDENRFAIKEAFEALKQNKQGLMIIGNPGGGKTLFFEIIQRITDPKTENFFIKIQVLDVVLQFNNKEIGHNVFRKWSDKNVFFDDLGTEDKGYLFGEKTEVFEKFIQFRYELFRSKKIKTHFTTNLSYQELKDRYGARCVSRLNEMCKVVMMGEKHDYKDRRDLKNFKALPPVIHSTTLDPDTARVHEIYRNMKANPQAPASDYQGLGSRIKGQLGT